MNYARCQARPLPTRVVVASQHPAFLDGLNAAPCGEDDYEVMGSTAGMPVWLTPSETRGAQLLVAAAADMEIDDVVPSGVRLLIDVKATARRSGAMFNRILQDCTPTALPAAPRSEL